MIRQKRKARIKVRDPVIPHVATRIDGLALVGQQARAVQLIRNEPQRSILHQPPPLHRAVITINYNRIEDRSHDGVADGNAIRSLDAIGLGVIMVIVKGKAS